MNRFAYVEARLQEHETIVIRDNRIKLYDGEQKTQFEDGELVLTTHRMFWGKPGEIARAATVLCLPLKFIRAISEEQASSYVFGRKIRLILHLRPIANDNLADGINTNSDNKSSFIKLSGKHGILPEFINALRETVNARIWDADRTSKSAANAMDGQHGDAEALDSEDLALKQIRLRKRTGIGGIEKAIEAKSKETDESIALAFQDLRNLMSVAKDMVNISRVISDKICSHKGEISDDETIRFKSYLLSLGIDDPVTRANYSNDTAYYRSLADQLCDLLLTPLQECGGMLSLADVYCRVNRARGLELLSPEDLLQACRLLNGPIKLRTFPSGAMVLQSETHDDELIATYIINQLEDRNYLTVELLAQLCNISLLLAKEQLLAVERLGKICRDESIEGLRFYLNLFLAN